MTTRTQIRAVAWQTVVLLTLFGFGSPAPGGVFFHGIEFTATGNASFSFNAFNELTLTSPPPFGGFVADVGGFIEAYTLKISPTLNVLRTLNADVVEGGQAAVARFEYGDSAIATDGFGNDYFPITPDFTDIGVPTYQVDVQNKDLPFPNFIFDGVNETGPAYGTVEGGSVEVIRTEFGSAGLARVEIKPRVAALERIYVPGLDQIRSGDFRLAIRPQTFGLNPNMVKHTGPNGPTNLTDTWTWVISDLNNSVRAIITGVHLEKYSHDFFAHAGMWSTELSTISLQALPPGAGGGDMVAMEISGKDFSLGDAPLRHKMMVDLDRVDLSTPGASFSAAVTDATGQSVGQWTMTNEEFAAPSELTAEGYADLNVTELLVLVFENGQERGRGTVFDLASPVALLANDDTPTIDGVEFQIVENSDATLMTNIFLANSILITIPGGPTVLGNQIALMPLDGDEIKGFNSLSLMSQGQDVLQLTATGVRSVGVPEPSTAADFDADGDVDGFDFLKWQRGESPNSLSQSDLIVWQDYFGTVASPITAASTGVPEPATGIMLLIGMATMLTVGRTVVSKLNSA